MIIDIVNYQSIKKAHLEIDGLVVVTGLNNKGKTSLQRAIKDFVLNSSPNNSFTKDKINCDSNSGYIQIDDTYFEVSTKGKILKRGEKIINSIKTEKPIHLVGMDQFLVIDNDKVKNCIPQFSFHRHKDFELFPFNLAPNQLYYVFSMMYDLESISKIQMTIKKEVSLKEKEIDNLKYLSNDLIKQIAPLKAIESFDIEKVKTLGEKLEELEKIKLKIDDLSDFKEGIKGLEEKSLKNSKLLEVLNKIVIKYSNKPSLIEKSNKIREYEVLIEKLVSQNSAKSINTKLIKKLMQAESGKKLIDNLNLLDELELKLKEVAGKQDKLTNASDSFEKIEELEYKNKDLIKIKDMLNEVFNLSRLKKSKVFDRATLTQNLTNFEESLAEFKVCEICGSDREHWRI